MGLALGLLVSFTFMLGFLAIVISMVKSKHFIKSFLFSVITGTGTLLIVHFTSLMTYFDLPINWLSLSVSAIGGLPSVLAMAVINFI